MFNTDKTDNKEPSVSILRELFRPTSKIPTPNSSKIVNYLIAISGIT